jgi:LCP family protein required for cell wall assembly
MIKKKTKKENKDSKIISKKNKSKKAWWKYAIATVLVLVVGYFGYQAWDTFNSIWTENKTGESPFLKLFGDVEAGQLRGEGHGRINILLLGIPGGNHNGNMLSDTNIVASIDPINNKAAMLSLPRDMWVNNPDTGGSSKLNAVHAYGEMQEEGYGPTISKKAMSEILDIPIHYYIRTDFKGVENLINAIDGITVEVEKDIYDPYFPDQYGTGYQPYSIETGTHHLNGYEALKYARSRYTTSDFDRAARQQQVLEAVKKKLTVKNILSQPDKLLEIFNIAKRHLKTDLQPDEIKRLAAIVEQIDTEEVANKVLDNSQNGYLYSSRINGASVLLPVGDDYTRIQTLAHKIFSEPYLEEEAARVEIQNGTTTAGLATETAEVLENFGYNVVEIKDAKKKNHKQSLIVGYTERQKPHTLDLLQKRIPQARMMSDGFAQTKADIILVLGSDFQIDDLYR